MMMKVVVPDCEPYQGALFSSTWHGLRESRGLLSWRMGRCNRTSTWERIFLYGKGVDQHMETFNTPVLGGYGSEEALWSMPKKAHEYQTQSQAFARVIKAMPSKRMFPRQVGKALDEQTFELVTTKQKVQAPENTCEPLIRGSKTALTSCLRLLRPFLTRRGL